jgi:hypothetical protein
MEASVSKIIVTNGDWKGARAQLKTTLETQNASFNAQLKAVFAPPKPQASAAEQQAPAAPAAKREQLLARSQKRG